MQPLWVIAIVLDISLVTLGVPLTLQTDFNGMFEGEFLFSLTEDIHGWEIIMTFSSSLTQLNQQLGTIFSQTSDNKTFTVVNKPDTGLEHKNTNFAISVNGTYPGSIALTGTATLKNLGVDPWAPPPAKPNNDGTAYNFNEILQKSILFYEAQRSGKLPPNNRIPWRGDSALNDRGDNGEDLTGGWYDAGDHIKFTFPLGGSVTLLTWGLLEFKDAYEAAGELDNMYDCIRWPLEYLIKCHPFKETFYVQVGSAGADHSYWGRPENMTMPRPARKVDARHPGSDIAADTAAALAAGYLAFKNRDPGFADTLLQHAKELFDFAEKYPGKFSDSLPDISIYRSSDSADEMSWGAAWLYLATNNHSYLAKAKSHYKGPVHDFNWDEKSPGCSVLLYNITREDLYLGDIETIFTNWMPGGNIPYTPKGLAFGNTWGSNRHAANMALIAIMASQVGVHSPQYNKWAESQINYILGGSGRSFVVGFGNNPPTHPHHRGSSCPMFPAPCTYADLNAFTPNPHVLYGGLVGGPGVHDEYQDRRGDYVRNEVAVDYNAGFQSAVAGLKALYMRGELFTFGTLDNIVRRQQQQRQ